MPSSERFARRLARLERELKRLGTTPQLAYSSVEDGAVGVVVNGMPTMQLGLQHDGTSTAASLAGPVPPTPTAPLVTPVPAGLTVYWDGTFQNDEVAPMDFTRVTVHAVPMDLFTEYDPIDQRFIIGFIPQATGGEISAHLPPEPYIVYLAAWSESGKFSLAGIPGYGEPLPAGGMTDAEIADTIATEIAAVNDTVAAGDSANATAIDNAVDDYLSRISVVQTATNAAQSAADAAAADAAAAQTALDNLKIGSVNLFSGGAAERGTNRFAYLWVADIFAPIVGETVTLSYDIKATIPATVSGPYPYQSSGITIQYGGNTDVTTDWVRHTYTATVYDNGPITPGYDSGAIAWYDPNNVDNVLSLRNIKIERGTVATDWTPSLAEAQSAVDAAQAAADAAQAAANAAQSTANSAQSAANAAAADVVAAQNDLDTLNSTTIPNLNTDLAAAQADLTTLGDKFPIRAADVGFTIGGGNLLPDSSFEAEGIWNTQAGPPTLSNSTTRAYRGTHSLRVQWTGPLGTQGLYSTGITPGPGTYTASVWVYIPTGSGDVRINLTNPNVVDFASGQYTDSSVRDSWQRIKVTGVVPDSSPVAIQIVGYSTESGQECYIDAAQIEQGDVATAYAPKPDEILPGTITSTEVADDAITTPKLVTGAVIAGKLAAGAVTADKIEAGAVTADKIEAGAVTADKIEAGAVTTEKMTANTINADRLQAYSISAFQIGASAITAEKIAAGAVTTEKLTVASLGGNLVANGAFAEAQPGDGAAPVGWMNASGGTGNFYRETGSPYPGGVAGIFYAPDSISTGYGKAVGRPFPVTPGDVLAGQMLASGAVGNGVPTLYFGLGFFSADPGVTSTAESDFGSRIDFIGGHAVSAMDQTTPENWERIAGTVTVPVGARFARPVIYNYDPSSNSYMVVSDVRVQKVAVSAQIADGAIITPKLGAQAVTADKIDVANLNASGSVIVGQQQVTGLGTALAGKATAPKRALFMAQAGGYHEMDALDARGWTRTTVTSWPSRSEIAKYDLVVCDSGYGFIDDAQKAVLAQAYADGCSVYTTGNDTSSMAPLFTGTANLPAQGALIKPTGTHPVATGWEQFTDGDTLIYLTGVNAGATTVGVTTVSGTDRPMIVAMEDPGTGARWVHNQAYAGTHPSQLDDAIYGWLAARTPRREAAGLKTLWGLPTDTTFINGGLIAARSIAAQSLVLSDFTNYFPDRFFNLDTSQSYFTDYTGVDSSVPPAGGRALKFKARDILAQNVRTAARPGDKFLVSMTYRKVSGTASPVQISIWMKKADGVTNTTAEQPYNAPRTVTEVAVDATWTRATSVVTIPATATDCAFVIPYIWINQSTPYSTEVSVSDLTIQRMNGGELIVDGSIKAKHATADLVEGLLVTGNVLQTDAAASRGIKISTSGLVGYNNTTGAPATVVDPTTGTLSMFDGSLTGGLFQTSINEKTGIKMGSINGTIGIYAYNPAGDVFFKAVPSEGVALVAGEVKAKSLTVSSSDPATPPVSSLGGRTEIGAGGYVILTAGVTAPASAPTVTTGYDSVQFANDGLWIYRSGLAYDGTYYYTARGFQTSLYIEKWSSAGALVSTSSAIGNSSSLYGITSNPSTGKLYLLQKSQTSAVNILRVDAASLALEATFQWSTATILKAPTIGVDATNNQVVTAMAVTSPSTAIQFQRFDCSGSGGTLTPISSTQGSIAYTQSLASIYVGNGDLGAARYIVTGKAPADEIASYTQAGAYQGTEAWDSGATVNNKLGVTYNTTLGQFVALDNTGLLRKYTGNEKTTAYNGASLTKWVSNTLAYGSAPTYQTDQSPRYKIVMPKRSKLTVTTSAIVGSGSNPPDRVKIYIGSGTTDPGRAAMQLLSTQPGVGVVTQDYTSLATIATAPPASNTFPAGSGSSLAGTYFSGGVRTEATFITNDGTIPSSPFRDAIDARVSAIAPSVVNSVPTGTIMMWGSATPPAGWLLCNGVSYLNTSYPALYNVIGYTFGNPGPGYFCVPNFQQRFPFGQGPDNVLGQTELGAGAPSGSGDIRRMDHTHNHSITNQANGVTATAQSGTGQAVTTRGSFDGHAHGGVTGDKAAVGVGTVHAYVTVNFIIKT